MGEIAQYIEQKNKEGWKGVVSEVTYARVRKNFNKEFVRLEFNVRDATPSRPLYESMKKWINTQPSPAPASCQELPPQATSSGRCSSGSRPRVPMPELSSAACVNTTNIFIHTYTYV